MSASDGMIQEELLGQPDYGWRMLIACILLNRTTGRVVRPVLMQLLKKWPTPRALSNAPMDEVFDIVRPAGFASAKSLKIICISAQWANEGPFTTIAPVSTLTGIGPYALDSWAIFVDWRRDVYPKDKKLTAWLNDPTRPHFDRMVDVFCSIGMYSPGTHIPLLDLKERYLKQSTSKDLNWWGVSLAQCATLIPDWPTARYKCARLSAVKHHAYGPEPLKAFGTYGVLVRSVDKICRMENLKSTGGPQNDESIEDTARDLVNYAALAILLIEGKI